MNVGSIPFEVLFAVQLLGTLVFVAGLVLGGLTMVTIVGGALIMLSIVGIALAAFADEEHVRSTEAGGDSDRTRLPFGLGSK